MKQYIRPRMEKDITDSISWRDKWGKISNVFFSFAEILCIIQTVLAFSASSYDLKLISYLAGMLGVLSISFNRFGTYARNASSEKTAQLNEILGTIGIKDMVPDLMDNDYGDGVKSQKSNK
jgi:exosortase/archaeosortase